MNSIIVSLLWAPLLAAPVDLQSAAELRYSGTLTQIGRNADDAPVKRCEIYCLVNPSDAGARNVSFLIDERGGDGWAWPERFGRILLDAKGNPTNPVKMQLLHNHDGILHPIAMRQPIFEFTDRLKEGAEWEDGRLTYEVTRTKKVNDHECWQIDVTNNFGRAQRLFVEQGTGLVVSAEQRIFMGRGDEFQLKWTLDSARPVAEAELAKFHVPFTTLLDLQKELNRKKNETNAELSATQLAAASKIIERLEKEAQATPFQRLAAIVNRDVKTQLQRTGNVAELARRFEGQPAPKFSLAELNKKPIPPEALADKIVVLHFWDYRSEPLVEPYGQVGYLDFLNNRRHKLGVEVIGVAVGSENLNPVTNPAVQRSVRKLKEFMNLGYTLAADDGSVLKKFGDPRTTGATLPLWVVIAPDGTIAHYKVGFYDIRPDEGLRPLDEVVVELIRKQRETKSE